MNCYEPCTQSGCGLAHYGLCRSLLPLLAQLDSCPVECTCLSSIHRSFGSNIPGTCGVRSRVKLGYCSTAG